MDVFTSAAELLRHRRPERPVLALRPHAARRAANWFLANFPGRVLYAAKANDAPPIMDALVDAGIRSFDVASLVEIERLARVPGAELYFMNPVKSRNAIVRAYRDFGVRSFAFDSDEELDKIVAEIGGAGDLNLFLRVACPNTHSLIPLEGKFGVSSEEAPALLLRARQVARRLGITFHVGSQAVVPAAFGEALRQIGQLDRDVRRHGRCHRYRRRLSEPLSPFRPARACELHGRDRAGPPTSSPSSTPASFCASRGVLWWRRPSR